MKQFYQVLINTLIANVTTSYLWFALTFWVYLETRSVMATAIIGGAYMLFVAICSLFFGTLVDRHKKKQVMVWATLVTLAAYLVAGLVYMAVDSSQLSDWRHAAFWVFGGIILAGAVVENIRNIALSTTVTLLVDKDRRDKANGLVGSVQGLAFVVTSVFSGLSVGYLGMGWTLVIAISLTALAFLHLLTVRIPEEGVAHDPELQSKAVDISGSIKAIRAVPGLLALVFFTTFNNLIGGVYMALMDPYGLTLFSVQMWGIVLGVTSTGFIMGGLLVAKFGLGKNPLRTMLTVGVVTSLVGMLFTVREFWPLFVLGTFLYMCLMPIAEAAEQTVIQRVVPFAKQGRVFGFAQSVEAAAAPITAFAIGPVAEFWLIPYMRSAEGAARFNWLLGGGDARGIALVFLLAGLIGAVVVLLAFATKSYRLLSATYAKA